MIPEGNDNNRVQCCACVHGTSLIMVIGLLAVGVAHWAERGAVVVCPGGVSIIYIGRARTGSSSLDAAPVTGSLVFSTPVYCLAVYCAAGFYSWLLFGGADCVWLAGC